MTRVITLGRGDKIWTLLSRDSYGMALNVYGDANGDLWPTIRESNVAPHHPWVVWSRFDTSDYDLAWSRWTHDGWEPISWLAPTVDEVGDDLDADVSFDAVGRPFVVWWRDDGGFGQVYLSLYLQTVWMNPYRVSSPTDDSRFPTIEVGDDGVIVVRFETAEGTVERTVLFSDPGTITDDINPLDAMVLLGEIIVVEDDDGGY